MDVAFNIKNTELRFFDTGKLSDRKKKLLLYPLMEYRVVAPQIGEDEDLNIFQKAILRLLNKKHFTAEKLSNLLRLDIKLIKTIISELRNKEYVDKEDNRITDTGKEIIKNGFSWVLTGEDISKLSYYIYQDPLTRQLIPWIQDIKDKNSFEYDKQNQKIKSGDKGQPQEYEFTYFNPIDIKLEQPTKEQIIEIFNEYNKQYIPREEGRDIKEKFSELISIAEKTGYCFAAIWIYQEDNQKDDKELTIDFPFSEDINSKLKDEYNLDKEIIGKLRNKANTNGHLKEFFSFFNNNDNKEAYCKYSKKLKEEVEDKMKKKLGSIFKTKYPKVYKALYHLGLEMEKMKESEDLKDNIGVCFLNMGKVLEELYEQLNNDIEDFYNKFNKEYYNKLPDQEVFSDVIIRMSNEISGGEYAKITKIQCNYQDLINKIKKSSKITDLSNLIIVSVLASDIFKEKYPIYQVIRKKRDYLRIVTEIRKERNLDAHKHRDLNDDELKEHHEKAKVLYKELIEIIEIINNYE